MTTFLLDLWQDLRAKRLWPVAVALLAAIVAVPAVLAKPTSGPPATAAAQASNATKLPTVTLDASSVSNSHLNVFKEKNPFQVLHDPDVTQQSGSAAGTTSATTPTGTGTSSVVGGSTATSPTGAPGSGTTPGSPTKGPDGKPVTPGVHYFTYTADVEFGPRGHEQKYSNIHELDLLPSGDNPIVSFMGVRDGSVATFFIADAAFRADGEGHCDPDSDHCMFVSLTTDPGQDEETLSAENGQVEYTLKLTGLHFETIDASTAVGDTTPASKASKRRSKLGATLLSMPAIRLKR